jgi:hypothetical protein
MNVNYLDDIQLSTLNPADKSSKMSESESEFLSTSVVCIISSQIDVMFTSIKLRCQVLNYFKYLVDTS